MGSRNANREVPSDIVRFRGYPQRKSSTLTVSRRGKPTKTAVHDLLECPVCMNVMNPPINQCPNGHTLCSKCRLKLRCCPICRQTLGNIRCLALEQVAGSLDMPCNYKTFGCREIFPYQTRQRHEQTCRFRPYNCPYAGAECPITGDIQSLVGHLKCDHKVDMHNGSTFNHKYVKHNPQDIENATWMLTVFNCFGHQFCLHFEAFNLARAPVYIAFIRFMGDDRDAGKFCYSLEVGSRGRKLIWHGVPRSIRDSHMKVRDSLDGLVIPRKMALFFSGSGGGGQELQLRVAGRIWKDEE